MNKLSFTVVSTAVLVLGAAAAYAFVPSSWIIESDVFVLVKTRAGKTIFRGESDTGFFSVDSYRMVVDLGDVELSSGTFSATATSTVAILDMQKPGNKKGKGKLDNDGTKSQMATAIELLFLPGYTFTPKKAIRREHGDLQTVGLAVDRDSLKGKGLGKAIKGFSETKGKFSYTFRGLATYTSSAAATSTISLPAKGKVIVRFKGSRK